MLFSVLLTFQVILLQLRLHNKTVSLLLEVEVDIVVAGNLTAKEGGNINVEGDFLSFGGEVDVSGSNAGAINLNSLGEISLGGTLNASSTSNDGGDINIKSQYKIVQSYGSEINSSGNTNGGDILLSAPNIMSSGQFPQKEINKVDILT